MTRNIKSDWTPVLEGHYFCSPSCGRGCTLAEYEETIQNANQMISELGEGWQAEVWENFGWHYAAKRGVFRVYYRPETLHHSAYYEASFNSAKQIIRSGNTALEAVEKVLIAVELILSQIKSDSLFIFSLGKQDA